MNKSDADARIAKIRQKVQEGFYFSKKIYGIIAEKIIQEIFIKK